MNILDFAPWIAAFCLTIGYWKQVYHIHKHKEVRDLNLSSYILFAISYFFLGIESYNINSMVFLVKNLLVGVPTIIIIFQIIYHKGEKWVGDNEYERMAQQSKCPKNLQMHRRINMRKAL